MRFLWLLLFLFPQPILFAQQLFVQPYPIEVYKGATQCWAITQDKKGVVYFANNDGVLRFDGTEWELIPLPNMAFVSSLEIDAEGRIYVGFINELGYFQKDSLGIYQYSSLLPQLPKEDRKNVKEIAYIKVFQNSVFFSDFEKVYLYRKGKFRVLDIKNVGFIQQQNRLYLVTEDGLYIYKNENFEAMDFNRELKEVKIWKISEYDQNSFLILDDKNKLWVFDPLAPPSNKLRLFPGSFNVNNPKSLITRAATLSNGNIAIVSKDEVHVVDKNGESLYTIAKDLFEDDIGDGFIFEDQQHNLWINGNSIILQVITSSPLSFYDKQNGIKGTILSLGKNDQHQYIGTSYSISYKENKTSFVPLPDTEGLTWNFYNFDQKLYAAHSKGVFEIQGKKVLRPVDHPDVFSLCQISRHPEFMIMGTYNTGIWLLEKKPGTWHKNKIKGFEEETRFIQEDEEGNIWISHYNKGIFKLRLNEKMDSVISKIFYDSRNGLPSDLNNRVFRLKNGKIIITTIDGFYSYNKIKDRFEPEEKYRQALGKGFCIYTLSESSDGNIYFWGAIPKKKEIAGAFIKQPDGTYKVLLTPFNKIAVPVRDLRVDIDAPILTLGPNEIWIGHNTNLICYNPTQKTFYDEPFQVSIRRVWVKDSSILVKDGVQSEVGLPFIRNNVRFEFANSFYESPEKVEYQYKLKGFENEWSNWGVRKEAFFTNLLEGDYTFSVRAKNLYGKISEPASFSFRIHPPWYRTLPAYSAYIIFLVFLFYQGLELNTQRIRKQKAELQRKVDEKTIELTAMNKEILAQNEEISAINDEVNAKNDEVHAKNDEIRAKAEELKKSNSTKDKMFSIVSHDLRGPIGQVQEILNLIDMNYMSEEELKIIVPRLKESIRHTLGLTDNLLFWAKNQMDEGLQLNLSRFDLLDIANENFGIFMPIAQRKEIQLINNINNSFFVFADKDMVKLIFRNLITNAIKFTAEGGTVTMGAEANQDYLAIFVEDTGTGISDSDIANILNKEGHSKYGTSGEKGMGLGLVVCKEFIELNKGTLIVESELGKGSKFTFTIPNCEFNRHI